MALCKFSSQQIIEKSLNIENVFFNEFLPYASGDAVKVYLFGLYLAGTGESADNNIDRICSVLNLDNETVMNYFWYWHEQGILQVIEDDQMVIKYLPIKNNFQRSKKIDDKKYEQFNGIVQNIFEGERQIMPTEFKAYYDLIEYYHFEQPALIMLIKYCVSIKGKDCNYPYIVAIAKRWSNKGIINSEKVEQKLQELSLFEEKLKDVTTLVGIKRTPNYEDRAMYDKWINDYGFDYVTICYVARSLKKKGGMSKLDNMLAKYFESRLFSENEIAEYETNKTNAFNLAKEVSKNLGLHFEDYTTVVDNYILKWLNMGFENEVISKISSYAFVNDTRKLPDLDVYFQKFFKLGIITVEALEQYFSQVICDDGDIENVLDKLGIVRKVNVFDRKNYQTWKNDWNISDELLNFGIEKAKGTQSPMRYLNKILSEYFNNGIDTVEKAKLANFGGGNSSPKENQMIYTHKSFSSSQVNALFDNIDEVEL